MPPILLIAYLALAIAAISMTTAKASIFRPLRLKVEDRNEWLGELVKCPYCTSHWLAFGAEAIYQPRLVHSGVALLDYALSAMAMVALATIFFGLIWAALDQMN